MASTSPYRTGYYYSHPAILPYRINERVRFSQRGRCVKNCQSR
jgi:hypothetical protein